MGLPYSSFTEAKKKKTLSRLCKQNLPRASIRAVLGITAHRLDKDLRSFGLGTNGHSGSQEYKKIPFDEQDVYTRYYVEHQTSNQIADLYQCSNVSVLNFIRQCGWKVRARKEAQPSTRLDKYGRASIQKYKKLYCSGQASIETLARTFNLSGFRLSAIAKEQGWFIPNYQHVFYEPLKGKDNGSYRARIRRLQNSPVTRSLCMSGYRRETDKLTKAVVKVFGHLLPGRGNSIDHVYPTARAFYAMDGRTHCKIGELCHPANLQWLPMNDNVSKHFKLTITLPELRRKIKAWNKRFGNPWKHPELQPLADCMPLKS